ncbi:MAG TPA: GNAT family N-acetyltransferase [Bacillus sp. (in: firmicutes)]|nr:GNAT family N-acetyltransferase [Bacillus sp. (in: firmicutes)]
MLSLYIESIKEINEKQMGLLLLADPSEQVVKSYIKRSHCLAANDGEKTVGIIALLPTRPETLEIVNVAVLESEQGKGYGKQLIQYAIEFARDNGYKTLEIGTGNSSLNQLGLYQKCGFRITGIDKDFFIRHYAEEIYENGIQCRDMIRLTQDI